MNLSRKSAIDKRYGIGKCQSIPIRAFFLEPTNRSRRYLRRYSGSGGSSEHYHDAWALIGEVIGERIITSGKAGFAADSRWPRKCEKCDYRFVDADYWQVFYDHIYCRQDSGGELTLREAPDGAMWDAAWMHNLAGWTGPDGLSLVAVCPGGSHWHIDGRANNCTLPGDLIHKCWVRHGDPPCLTVDKNGVTCAAGAGSIQTSNWHGFLRDGLFVE